MFFKHIARHNDDSFISFQTDALILTNEIKKRNEPKLFSRKYNIKRKSPVAFSHLLFTVGIEMNL